MVIAGLLIAGFILAGSVSAFGANFGAKGMVKGPPGSFFVSDEVRNQMDAAIANNDYEAFKTLQSTNFPNAPVMTQEQFDKIVERHSFEQKIEAAIDSGNYEEWKTLMGEQNDPRTQQLLTNVTADNFHLLKEWKDTQAKLQSIQDELGFSPHPFGMEMHGRGIKVFNQPVSVIQK